ncbi:MAG: NIPSNAP family protein [Dehalococcoidia bacterium]
MIMVQRESRVDPKYRAAFEAQSREGQWPAFLHFGAQMVAYGTWGFGGPDDVVVTNTVYVDLDHWASTRTETGACYTDAAMLKETEELRPKYLGRDALVISSAAKLMELDPDVSRPCPFRRSAGQQLTDLPPTFGRGSVISERTLELKEGKRGEFRRLSAELVWPWLESQGGRVIGLGWDLMGSSNEVITWFAFKSLQDWYRFARPSTAHAPAQVAEAYNARANLVQSQRGRLLVVGTDWGAQPA